VVFRRKKESDGTCLTSQTLSGLLPSFLAQIDKKRGDGREEICRLWFQLLGEKMGPMTEVVSFLDGILTVKVKSSTLYSLLCQHEKPRLLGALRSSFAVRDIKFRVG
jgi:hypothetical protein